MSWIPRFNLSSDPPGIRRWIALGFGLGAVLVATALRFTLLSNQPEVVKDVFDGLFLLLVGGLLVFQAWRLRAAHVEMSHVQQQLAQARQKEQESFQHLATVFRISQLFTEAKEESQVVDLALRLSREILGASGASFVPLDERNQALAVFRSGSMPEPVTNDWLEYLATPSVRQRCGACTNHDKLMVTCPLLTASVVEAKGIYCLPLSRGDQEFGVLNLYLPAAENLSEQTRAFLRTIVDETTLALEGVRLRRREITTLQQLQAVREKTDLRALLLELLENLHATLEVDVALIALWDESDDLMANLITRSELDARIAHLAQGVLLSVKNSRTSVILGNASAGIIPHQDAYALMGVPLLVQNQPPLGAILVAGSNERPFQPRQLNILEAIANQVALVVHNVNSMADLEYKTMIEERTRLAREIHDGLAQTLGFLKLKLGQMKHYLEQGDLVRLQHTLPNCYDALADAYQDARQAIDGLHLSSFDEGLRAWLPSTLEDFQEANHLTVTLHQPLDDPGFPPEVHAQLARIVQETLNNIRKHARASHVHISSRVNAGEFLLEIQDDGLGFNPDDVTAPAQHGLRSMRERAELIGADFQVTSRRSAGTLVSLRIPLEVKEKL